MGEVGEVGEQQSSRSSNIPSFSSIPGFSTIPVLQYLVYTLDDAIERIHLRYLLDHSGMSLCFSTFAISALSVLPFCNRPECVCAGPPSNLLVVAIHSPVWKGGATRKDVAAFVSSLSCLVGLGKE